MYNLQILTPHSLKSIDKWQRCAMYGHFIACGSFKKMAPKPIDWILHPGADPCMVRIGTAPPFDR